MVRIIIMVFLVLLGIVGFLSTRKQIPFWKNTSLYVVLISIIVLVCDIFFPGEL